MKLFIDTANIDEIKRYAFIIDGVTTNPSLIAEERDNFNFEDLINNIVKIIDGPISVEAISLRADELINESKKLSEISPNIVVKIPMTEEGLKATKVLSSMNIKTNVTLIFSANQALLAAKAGATYASIFIGRLDDIGHDGLQVVKDTMSIYKEHDFATKVISASIRHPLHVINAAKFGSHVATVPAKILKLMLQHNLTDAGLNKFLEDWNHVRK